MPKVTEKRYNPDSHIFFDKKKYDTPSFIPTSLGEFIGQEKLKKRLEVYINSAIKRGKPLDHMLFFGPPGLGKTTLVEIISNTLKKKIKYTSGPVLNKTGDLLSILSLIKEGEILFIDEIHRLPTKIEEVLYSAMEQYKIDIIIGTGATSKTVSIPLPPFTLISATTKLGLLSKPLQSRFGIIEKLEYYSPEELSLIVKQTANFFSIKIDEESILKIGSASRGIPRVAKKIMAKIRDYAFAKTNQVITKEIIHDVFSFFNILDNGLTYQDISILKVLNEKNHPIGLELLSSLTSEEPETIEDFYEPFLLKLGFIERTPKGRIIRPEKKNEIKKIIYPF